MPKEIKETQGRRAIKVTLVPKATKETRDLKEIKATQGHKVIRATRVPKAIRATRARATPR